MIVGTLALIVGVVSGFVLLRAMIRDDDAILGHLGRLLLAIGGTVYGLTFAVVTFACGPLMGSTDCYAGIPWP